jgi:hypothetical protein
MRRSVFGANIVAAALMASGFAVASGQPASTAEAGPAASALPPWLHKTVHADAYVAPASPFVPNIESAGTAVPGYDVTASASDNSKLKFGLATFPTTTQTYPAISTNGGTTWKVDGPLFHVDALQGASVVASSGVLAPYGAYFWGRGGNLIWITHDEGAHWWKVVFGAGVDELSARDGTLEVVVFGAQVNATALQKFLYRSTDLGRTWRLRRQLADLHADLPHLSSGDKRYQGRPDSDVGLAIRAGVERSLLRWSAELSGI